VRVSNKTRDLTVLQRLTEASWGVGGQWVQLRLSQGNGDPVGAATGKNGCRSQGQVDGLG